MMRMPDFAGLAPWETTVENIECVTAEGAVDMYNASTLRGSALNCSPVPILSFSLVDNERERGYALEFRGVRDLVFRQDPLTSGPGLWDPARVKTFYGVDMVISDDLPAFEVRTIVGDYEFGCGSVLFCWI